MTTFEFGTVVLIAFPFTDQTGSKQRPAVVISSNVYQEAKPDIILMAVTSQSLTRSHKLFGDVIIEEWKTAGLLRPSVIKPVIFTAEKRLIRKKLGQLKKVDIQQLKQNLTVIIG